VFASVLDIVDQRLLELALFGLLREPKEIEDVGVLRRLQSTLRIGGVKRDLEVRQGSTLALVQAQIDLTLELPD
jgi:hypothetical protein